MKLNEIKSELDREILKFLEIPKTIPQVAAECGIQYNSACTKLMVLEARGLVMKSKRQRKSYYHLNRDLVELSGNVIEANEEGVIKDDKPKAN